MANVRSLNRVILLGRVGKEPEITHIPNLGKDVAKFSLATNEGYMDKNNQWQDSTEWHNIVAWDWNAKKVERSLSKGVMVLIEGKIKTRKWQDKESGVEKRTTEIYVDNLVPLEKQNREGSSPREGGGYNQNTSQNNDSAPGGYQAPPEAQIDDVPYDNPNDPF
jgi:single-strand DNA-binding protein